LKLSYGVPTEADRFQDLLQVVPDAEFQKLTRSTIPLLAYWSKADHVRVLCRVLGFTDNPTTATFEYSVPARCRECGSKGKASFTDVMLKWSAAPGAKPDSVAAIEVKHTEDIYSTVGRWLGPERSTNRRAVLRHWWHLIWDGTGKIPDQPYLDTVVYQMVHRTASACSLEARKRTVVLHLIFSHDQKKIRKYETEVKRLATAVGAREGLEFWVISIGCVPTPAWHALDDSLRGLAEEERADRVRDALASGDPLFDFGDITVASAPPG
jgi:hypothetical protein